MAVAIDGGLITPTIIKAQDLDLFSISRNWKELVDKAKAKKLTPAEYSSGSYLWVPNRIYEWYSNKYYVTAATNGRHFHYFQFGDVRRSAG